MKKPVRSIACLPHIQELIEKILEEYQLSFKCELRRNAYLLEILADLVEEYMSDAPGMVHFYPGTVYAPGQTHE